MEPKNEIQDIPLISTDRLKAIADGVFSVAMTLLVLELGIPVIQEASNTDLTIAFFSMWPKFIAYVLSFLIVGIYWLIHHFIFDQIMYYDSTLAWINIIFLLFVALIPFSTSLLGEYFMEKTPTIVYGFQLLLMFLMGFSLWTYGTSKKYLLARNVDPGVVKGGKQMGYVYFSILTVSVILGFFIPLISIILYGIIVILFIAFTVIGKPQHVIIVPGSQKKK